jgi:thioesterase domain-containing protein
MTGCSTVVYLPGAGGAAPDLSVLRAGPDDATQFVALRYPGWKRYVEADFSPQALIRELADDAEGHIPAGPIELLGMSIGGHFCYALALELRARGRQVAGVCLIDSFMVRDAGLRAGWVRRAVQDLLEPLRRGSVREFLRHLAAKFYRAFLRLAGARLAGLLRQRSGGIRDPLLESEVSMRLLLRETAPWLGRLDLDPVPLNGPVALLRTPLTGGDDAAWRRRCPDIRILEVQGGHQTLFEPEFVAGLRAAFNAARRDWRVG